MTPILRVAEVQNAGTIARLLNEVRSPAINSSSVRVPFSKNFSISESSPSATISINWERSSSARSFNSAGMSDSLKVAAAVRLVNESPVANQVDHTSERLLFADG